MWIHLPRPKPSNPHTPPRDRTHHKDRFDGYPDMMFPFLPRGRHVICTLHGMEKIASWVICTLYDFLEQFKDPAPTLGHR